MASDMCAGVLVAQAQNKKLQPNDRRAAALAVMDRAGLKPTDTVVNMHVGPDGGPVQLEVAEVLRARQIKRAVAIAATDTQETPNE